MLRPIKIATSNSLGYLGLEWGFAFGIQALDSECFYNFVSSSGLPGVTGQNDI